MPDKIFISYRRDDSKAESRSIYQRLERALGEGRLFMDVDTIEPGQNFRSVLDQSLASCKAMLVVIGQRWLSASGADGKRRIDDAGDFVSMEIASALKRGVHVIPVLVDGARMPTIDQLPPALQPLASQQAAIVTHENFTSDMVRIERQLNALVPEGGLWRGSTRFWIVGLGMLAVLAGAAGWLGLQRSSPRAVGSGCAQLVTARTPPGVTPATTVRVTNRSSGQVRVFWIDGSGAQKPYGTLASGQSMEQPTFVGHIWLATDPGGRCLGTITAESTRRELVVQ